MQQFWICIIVIIVSTQILKAQNPPKVIHQQTDSLIQQIDQLESNRYEFVRTLERTIRGLDSMSKLQLGEKVALKLKNQKHSTFKTMSPALMAYLYDATQNRTLAIAKMKQAIKLAKKQGNKALLAELYRDFGYLQNAVSDGNSIKSFLKSYELFTQLRQKKKAIESLYVVATTQYGSNAPIKQKIASFQEIIKQSEGIRDSLPHRLIINSYTAIGMLHFIDKQYPKTEKYLEIAFKLSEEKQDSAWIGILSGNFALLYGTNGEYRKAIKYMKIDLHLSKKNNERLSLAHVYGGLGGLYLKLKQYDLSKAYYDSSRVVSTKGNSILKQPLQKTYYGLSMLYANQQDYKQAYKYRDLAAKLNDTLNQRKLKNKVNEVQAAYNFDKKQKEVLLLTKENDLKEATIQRQNTLNIAIGFGLSLTLVLVIVLYKSNKVRKDKNGLLKEQQNEIVTQNEELIQQREEILAQQSFVASQNEELSFKNQQISHSINAALNIQKAILPYEKKLQNLLQEYFVLYRPKDVVSGDFYWINKVQDKTILIAADCTGHGVPGAFMSLICHTLFDKIIRTCQITDSVQILNRAQNEIRELLRQKELGYANGMDVCLIVMQKIDDTYTQVQFTGARRPLYVIAQGKHKVDEIRGDRTSIGGRLRRGKVKFSNHQLKLKKGDLLYLSSDGYADQNNENRRSYTTLQLKKLLESISSYDMPKQKQILEETLDQHMEGTDQRDDIMLIGVKLG